MSITVRIGLEKLDRFVASLLFREGIKITLQKPRHSIDYDLEDEEIIKRLEAPHL